MTDLTTLRALWTETYAAKKAAQAAGNQAEAVRLADLLDSIGAEINAR